MIEIAGFGNFEEYKVNFIEKAGEFLAAALLNVETTQQMKIYLEQSQEQREIMNAQEEEMYIRNTEMEEALLAMKNKLEKNV